MSNPFALIIDDNQLNREILATLTEKAGLKAVSVNSPQHITLSSIDYADLRVIFLDLEMPNHDGFEIHRKLRADAHLNNVPVIAYTVHTSEIDRVRRAGFDGFLGKPIDPDRFPIALRQILNGQAVWDVG